MERKSVCEGAWLIFVGIKWAEAIWRLENHIKTDFALAVITFMTCHVYICFRLSLGVFVAISFKRFLWRRVQNVFTTLNYVGVSMAGLLFDIFPSRNFSQFMNVLLPFTPEHTPLNHPWTPPPFLGVSSRNKTIPFRAIEPNCKDSFFQLQQQRIALLILLG